MAAWGKIEGRTNIRWGRGGEKVWEVRQSSPVTMTRARGRHVALRDYISPPNRARAHIGDKQRSSCGHSCTLQEKHTVLDDPGASGTRRWRPCTRYASDASARPQCVTAKFVISALTGRRRCFVRQGLFHHFTIFTSLVHHLMTLGATTRSTLGRLMGARR